MADKLYRSHSLEKSAEGISGSITFWEDSPVSQFEVGDSFSPVYGGPTLTVDKVSIKDNVIGELYGKPVRQWEVVIEGSNNNSSSDTLTHVKYNFNISSDEKSGTMEVVNIGDTPSITLNIGEAFSVPGIGSVYCSNVKGSDDFDDSGVHTWTVIYEGSDNQEAVNPLPESLLPKTKYNLAIEKDNDGDIQQSGSMSVTRTGNSPALDISVGSTFSIPGIGTVTCSKITANDDYTDTGTHCWTMTYEGYTNAESSEDNAKYSFSIEKDSSGEESHSGSVEITTTGNAPSLAHNVGSTINLPGIGEVTCTKVSGSDSYSDTGKRKWTVVYEGTDNNSSDETNVKYNLNIENNSDGITVYSGSKEITSTGNEPTSTTSIGGKFSLPLVGEVTCTRIQSSNEDANTWKVVIEGSRIKEDEDNKLPDTETDITYEINGSTVRTVAGELVVLRRSETPITKKSITVYTKNDGAVASPGSSYQGGIVTSENIVKETIKSNGVVIKSYYKHTIEVEA